MTRMNVVRPAFAMALGALLLVVARAGAAADFPPPGKMRYVVTRNGDQIGTHEMEFVRDGNRHHVIVEPSNDGLWVTEHNHRKLFPGVRLVGTLWNPETIGQTLLVDPVDGRLRQVSIVDRGLETVWVQGRSVQARHISIT